MNTPAHFKEQLADELHAHATSLSTPAGHRVVLRPRAPRRRTVLTVGLAAAAAAVAVALPLDSGAHSTQKAAPTPLTASTGPASRSTPGTGLYIVDADYAVRSQPGGLVSVQLFDTKGVPGLQAALDKAGIPAKVLVPSASCRTTGSSGRPRGSLTEVVPPSGYHRDGVRDIKPGAIRPGDHLLFIAETDGGAPDLLAVRLVGTLPECVPAGR
ncbi:hypothetical protein ABZ858_18710 [Streptomyces sp. NPDC047017]|uniref:hypothetical protein n=1 Tax=Streptomyces sp. NPDC047017 TaxID=3155024 RepID=UPI0033DBF77D